MQKLIFNHKLDKKYLQKGGYFNESVFRMQHMQQRG